MPAQIITTDDLREFKIELLDEIRVLISEQKNPVIKKWMKSVEVRKLLNISSGTLQTLRINGTLPYTKIGGTNYYNVSDIDTLLSQNLKKKTRWIIFFSSVDFSTGCGWWSSQPNTCQPLHGDLSVLECGTFSESGIHIPAGTYAY